MNSPPTPQNVRLTISVTPEVHATFTRLANASGMSLGRAMGEWLGDTIDAADYLAQTVEKAREAPKLVARELHAYALGLADETGTLMAELRNRGRTEGRGAAVRPVSVPKAIPPSGNTGGKGPKSTTKPSGRPS
jgi:phage tail tape-measure protein